VRFDGLSLTSALETVTNWVIAYLARRPISTYSWHMRVVVGTDGLSVSYHIHFSRRRRSPMLPLLFGISSLIIWDLPLVQEFLDPNNYIHTLLIRYNHVDFCILKSYYDMLWPTLMALGVKVSCNCTKFLMFSLNRSSLSSKDANTEACFHYASLQLKTPAVKQANHNNNVSVSWWCEASDTINCFKSRLDKFWTNQNVLF